MKATALGAAGGFGVVRHTGSEDGIVAWKDFSFYASQRNEFAILQIGFYSNSFNIKVHFLSFRT